MLFTNIYNISVKVLKQFGLFMSSKMYNPHLTKRYIHLIGRFKNKTKFNHTFKTTGWLIS